jgi:DNA-binding NtrC family response regulator
MRKQDHPQPHTVLIVDDDQDLRRVLAEFLAVEGFETRQAGDGLEALREVERQRPDAMLLDILMPRLGGLSTLDRVRALDPHLPVILMTATLDPMLLRHAISSGASAVLAKPLQLDDVAAALRWQGAEEEEPPVATPRSVATARKVLVVDDDPDMREMLQELLNSCGYDVRVAADGLTALRAFVEESPDVVLLDIRMPGIDGIDVLASIREIDSCAKVIMLTGITRMSEANEAFNYGVYDYIGKPVDPAYLELSIETALMQKRLEND